MTIKSNRWEIMAAPEHSDIAHLSESLGVSEITARLLANRNLKDADEARTFLHPTFDKMRNPFCLKDMDRAVDRIRSAISKKEKICIYGDYDVDGVTSTAIMLTYFRRIGYDDVISYIPGRKTEGYGLNCDAVETISERGCGLLLTVDCGITSIAEVDHANGLGLDVIITDHHTPLDKLPDACAVVNPKRRDCGFGFGELAGAGIAFKLVQALSGENDDLGCYAELSALGTVADVVPLVDENRIIVKTGLEALNGSANLGLIELKAVSGLSDRRVDAGNIAFMLAPRINAAGRMGKADMALSLLMAADSEEAGRLAGILDEMNKERQTIEEGIFKEAAERVDSRHMTDKNILVISGKGWDSGIIGIVASKLSEKYSRPVVMIAEEETVGKASCRSFGSIDLYELLDSCREFFLKFGGHRQAAGFSIPLENIETFSSRLEGLAMERISPKELTPRIGVDCVLDTQKIDFNLIEDMVCLEPFGYGNAKPKFISRNLSLDQYRYVGKNQKHLKASFSENNRVFDAIGFNMDGYRNLIGKSKTMDVVFNLEKNVFRNVESIQMNLKDMRINERDYYAVSEWGRRYLDSFPGFMGGGLESNGMMIGADCLKEDVPPMLAEEGVVVAVYTLEGLFRLMGCIEESLPGIVDFNEILHFGQIRPMCKDSCIVVLPDRDSVRALTGMKIVNYDGYGLLEGLDCVDASEPSDRLSFDEMVKEMLPERKHLVDTYKRLMKEGTARQGELEKELDVPFLKLKASLWILRNCNLIDFRGGGYAVLEAPEEKIDIFEDSLYMALNGYRE